MDTVCWLLELARLPVMMSFGFVTGCQMANFTALAAARHRVLRDAGWEVEGNGEASRIVSNPTAAPTGAPLACSSCKRTIIRPLSSPRSSFLIERP